MKIKLAALLSSAVIVALSACSENPTTTTQATKPISEAKIEQQNPLRKKRT